MSIAKQVEEVEKGMKQLLEDMNNTDIENIDIEQVKQFGKFCRNYQIDIQELVYELKRKMR